MSPRTPLSPDRLYRACDTGHFTFETTAELDDLSEGIGQMRAIDAAHFGIGMRHAGYNLYVMGPPGSGKRYLMRQLLDQRVGEEAKPADWCYVHNFSQPHKPRAIGCPREWARACTATCSSWCPSFRRRSRPFSRAMNTAAA
jgi:hypothetical protein